MKELDDDDREARAVLLVELLLSDSVCETVDHELADEEDVDDEEEDHCPITLDEDVDDEADDRLLDDRLDEELVDRLLCVVLDELDVPTFGDDDEEEDRDN